MSYNVKTNPTDVAHDTTGYSLETAPKTGHSYRVTEQEGDRTLCGRDGLLRQPNCKLFKLTVLAILPGLIIIVRDAMKVASDVQVFCFNLHSLICNLNYYAPVYIIIFGMTR